MSVLGLFLSCLPPVQQPSELPALLVGAPAPPLAVAHFLRGTPRTRLDPGRVYLIEFWTVWCGPCIAGMPHLSALERELGPRGLTVIGVAPRPDEWGHDPAAIEALLARKGDQISYSIALDSEGESEDGYQGVFRGKTIESWMGAARVGAVPIAFVVDREGRIAAIAPPLEIDGVVRACLDGTFDRDEAAERYLALLAARGELEEMDGLLDRGERELALALGTELLEGPMWHDARYLAALAGRWFDAGPSGAELALALRAVQRANLLTRTSDPGTLGLLARLLHVNGEQAGAERTQARALELSEGPLRAAIERDYALLPDPPAAAGSSAIEGVLACFERAPLVGLAEHHRRREVHDFLLALIDHPRFGEVVDDVVVEFGNARHQALVDRYMGGEEVAPNELEELARVWRDTTQWLVWDSPLYQRFFERMRARNQARPAEERVRVLLGDPPIRWEEVQDAKAYRRFAERDAHFAAVVESEVLARGRRALLVTGSTHLELHGPLDASLPHASPSAGALLAQRHPGTLAVVWTLPAERELARRLGFERAPAFRDLLDDPLREESFALLAPRGIQVRVGGEWKALGDVHWPALGEMAAALLYVGDENTQVEPDPAIYRDVPFQTELRRRAAILGEVYGMEFQLP